MTFRHKITFVSIKKPEIESISSFTTVSNALSIDPPNSSSELDN